MTDINHVVLIGRMTRDIGGNDFAYTAGGTARLNIGIAVNESRKQDGQWAEAASFFDVTIWGKTAEAIRPYLGKGKQVCIDGRLQQQRWQTQDGSNRSKIVVIANAVQLLGGKGDDQRQQDGGEQQGWGGPEFPEDVPF